MPPKININTYTNKRINSHTQIQNNIHKTHTKININTNKKKFTYTNANANSHIQKYTQI